MHRLSAQTKFPTTKVGFSPLLLADRGLDVKIRRMGQRQRWILFLIGALVGVGILWVMQTRSNPARDEKRRVREQLNLPGMMFDYAVTQKGFYGHYVLYESVQTLSDGTRVRSIVTGGRRHYAADGTELPEERLWIEETYAPGIALAEAGPVKSYTFTFADRLTIKLKSGRVASDVVLPSGDVAVPLANQPGCAIVFLKAWQKASQPTNWKSLPDFVKTVNRLPAVDSAELTKINWQAEADLIKANTAQ